MDVLHKSFTPAPPLQSFPFLLFSAENTAKMTNECISLEFHPSMSTPLFPLPAVRRWEYS
jgi:hypothetical protein